MLDTPGESGLTTFTAGLVGSARQAGLGAVASGRWLADTVLDLATFDEPRTAPAGIPYVLVNGEFVIDDGKRTEARPGRAIRRTGARSADV